MTSGRASGGGSRVGGEIKDGRARWAWGESSLKIWSGEQYGWLIMRFHPEKKSRLKLGVTVARSRAGVSGREDAAIQSHFSTGLIISTRKAPKTAATSLAVKCARGTWSEGAQEAGGVGHVSTTYEQEQGVVPQRRSQHVRAKNR